MSNEENKPSLLFSATSFQNAVAAEVTPQSAMYLTAAKNVATPADLLTIDSAAMEQVAIDELSAIKKRMTELNEARMSITRPMDQAKEATMKIFSPALEYLKGEDTKIRGKVIAYQNEQQRLLAEAQAKADAEAKAVREAAEREAAQVAAKAAQDAAKLAEEAKLAEQSGDAGKAAALAVEAEQVIENGRQEAAIVQQSAPAFAAPVAAATKAKGTSTAKPWKGRLTDKAALVKYVAEHPEWLHLLDANQTAINAAAKAQQANCNIAGIEAYQDQQLRVA